MISVEEALARLLAPLEMLPPEQVSVADAVGRVLAEDVAARRTQPPFAVSAMDGYAVRAADVERVPMTLRIVAEIPAGAGFGGRLGAGEAARIFTGAPLPDGADAIVIQEDTERSGDTVEIREGAPQGRYVRRAGLDFAEGEVLLRAPRRLTPRDIGLAAAMNRPWLFVHRRPRVAILSTGDEIVMPGDPVGPHQIVSSNALALSAFVTASGGVPVLVGNAPDDPEALRHVAAAARGVDLFVTTGGVSVGEHDLVRDVLSEDGLAIDFWEIAMRPGKPLMFGRRGAALVFGLPGNPVSALVTAALFALPVLRGVAGHADPIGPRLALPLAAPLPPNGPRRHFRRARLEPAPSGTQVMPIMETDSAHLLSLALADALIVQPEDDPGLPAGAVVEVVPLE
jgi:molybdopterin molybdotransferase